MPSYRSGGQWGTGAYKGQRGGQECERKWEEGKPHHRTARSPSPPLWETGQTSSEGQNPCACSPGIRKH